MGFGDYEYALKFRDHVKKMVLEILEQERPQPKVGRVVDIDRASGIAFVVYPGNEGTTSKVKIYPGTQPLRSDRINGDGNGSVVRVTGMLGSRYVSEVLNSGRHLVEPRLFRPMISSGGSGDSSIRQMYGFTGAEVVPPADSVTRVQVAQFLLPASCGRFQVYTELTGGGDAYSQQDTFMLDVNTTVTTWLSAASPVVSSSGMALTVQYMVTVDTAGLLVDIGLMRASSSTRVPTSTAVQVDLFSTDASLAGVADGFV